MREGAEQSESRCMPGADMQTYRELHIQIALRYRLSKSDERETSVT
jgi:hypothetical protein